MAAIIVIVLAFIVLAAFDAASVAWGVDSRESGLNDHHN